ncbi:tRNA-dihydrouridine synthase 3 [Endocarpon pusillum]|uniref:tRNA-dihydrouridine(47) synthase [NAD(P)(+)] n=1 Tax=Endocarpon pusillum TaxID=364733 RepID=A0A8H7AMF6_9EURO|nr:tRNA-dihydrouridine synthase 3 [Endocarpon pusillum]
MAESHEPAVNGNTGLLNGFEVEPLVGNNKGPIAEKRKLDEPGPRDCDGQDGKRRKGTAPVREEYLIRFGKDQGIAPKPQQDAADDDAAEAFHHKDRAPASNNSRKRGKNQGQNTGRKFGKSRDEVALCSSRTHAPEFSPSECTYGERCRFEHNLRKYLQEHKREDLTTFDGTCPVWQVLGYCGAGWKCRFVGSHSKQIEHADGRKELILVEDEAKKSEDRPSSIEETGIGVVNSISPEVRISLTKRKFHTPKTEIYLKWLDSVQTKTDQGRRGNSSSPEPADTQNNDMLAKEDNRCIYKEPPFLPSEKRRLYFDASTPVLAPLTTQGNLPFRRLCSSLGAVFTYSEMAMSLPLIQGHKPEWALIKAHESELQPPTLTNKDTIVHNHPAYIPSTDSRFSAQIAANKPWVATKATEVLTALLPPNSLRSIDLNVGCPIDLVYREGAGSALMDSPAKLEKILHGMNVVSGTTPITCKIRMGTKDGKPTAQKLVERLILGGGDETSIASLGGATSGVAAITLHGRSRQQRYTRSADWEYIADTAALIKRLNNKTDALSDTIHDQDPRTLPPGADSKVFFLGNGDCYSHTSYDTHITESGVDTVMVARGALQKPWIFEEIAAGQSLDKSSSERLGYIERFCRYGLEAWGSDEWGVGTTRRFLLEWLSFACRYVPIGLLERVPTAAGSGWMQPSIQDRAPAYRGRDELETLMASEDYRDWIKLSEMFLGPAHKDFRFEPKHRSNAYEIQAEG